MNCTRKFGAQMLFVSLLLNYHAIVLSTTFGSSTAISNQAGNLNILTDLVGNPPNDILFGAVVSAGFTLNTTLGAVTATWHSCFPLFGSNAMNGQTMVLGRDMYWGAGSVLTNGGVFTCAGFPIIFPEQNSTFSIGTSASTFNGGMVKFNSPVALSTSLIFQGTSILDGGGNVITCTNAGKIAVGSGSSLLIRNVILQGIGAGQLYCQDNAGTLSLQNVTIIQDAAYSFTLGVLTILNDVEITGSNVFAFQSTNSLNINSFAELFLDEGSTFSYDTSNASLLKFSDVTSTLFLNGATLYTTGTGINLTNGTLNINSNSFFSSTGTLGVTLGNCVSANDVQVNMLNNAQLTVSQGLLNYKNVNASSFNMFNSYAQIVMSSGTTLNVFKNLNGIGTVQFGANTTLGTAPGISLGISSIQTGAFSFATLPTC